MTSKRDAKNCESIPIDRLVSTRQWSRKAVAGHPDSLWGPSLVPVGKTTDALGLVFLDGRSCEIASNIRQRPEESES